MTNKMFLNSHCWKELKTKLFLLHARKNLLVIVVSNIEERCDKWFLKLIKFVRKSMVEK